MSVNQGTKSHGRYAEEDRRALFRYVALTIVLFVPLLLTFISIRDLYPFAASRMMIWNGDRQGGRSYYMLRGETVNGETIDLLLTDMRMPFMGGAELASQLRTRRGTLKLLCISGYAGGHELEFSGDFLAKPFSRDQLLAKVREILDRP